jgi:hypothetical protein
MPKAKPILNKKMWAYFAPDGYLQVRSISYSKKQSRGLLTLFAHYADDKSWMKYEKAGYFPKRIMVNITIKDEKRCQQKE